METTPPFPVVSGQRQLAVIMFTDAVGFSARMHEQEVATLNRMERDLEAMRRTIGAQGGAVLKTTGDGLLIQFASAVQAVSCALEIQQGFSGRPAGGATAAILQHRIGIHLGDVFVGQGDVMGDGVNITARIVNEAPAGGIVISQTVHDVVKHKLPLNTVRLGPRQLKNIKEPIPLYRVLLDAPAPAVRPPPEPAAPPPPEPAPAPAKSNRALPVLLAGLAIGAAGWFVFRAQSAHRRNLSESQSAQAALEALLRQAPAGDGVAAAPREAGFDFAATAAGRAPAGADPAAMRPAAEEAVAALLAWLPSALARHTKDRPLHVASLGHPQFPGATIFTEGGRRLFLQEGGAYRRLEWAELKPPMQAAILAAAVRHAVPPAPAEMIRAAEAFAWLHGQPELVGALRP